MARPVLKAQVLGGRGKSDRSEVPVVGDAPIFDVPTEGADKYSSNPLPDLPFRESSPEERGSEAMFEMPENPFENILDGAGDSIRSRSRAPMISNDDSIKELSGGGNPKKLKGPQDFDDIFAYGQYLMQQGMLISYHIRKNGTVVAGKEECSLDWEKLQKKYGGGQYQITMKNQRKGTWITRVTEEISEPTEPTPTIQQQQQQLQQQQNQQQQNQQHQVNPAEAITAAGSIMSTLLQSTKESNAQLTNLIAQLLHKQTQPQPQQSNGLAEMAPVISAVLQTMGNRDNGLPQMMAEMTKSQQSMLLEMSKLQMSAQERQQEQAREVARTMQAALDKMSQNTMDMIREMRTEIGHGTQQKEGMSPMEMITLILQSRDTGFQTARALHREMEDRAKDLAETLSGREAPSAPVEEKSSTDRLIEMLVPVFGAVMQSKIASAQPPPQLPPAPRPQARMPQQLPPQQYRPGYQQQPQRPQQQQPQYRQPPPPPSVQYAPSQPQRPVAPTPVPAQPRATPTGAIPTATAPAPAPRPSPITTAARPVPPRPAPIMTVREQVDEAYLEAHLPLLGNVLTEAAASGSNDPAAFASAIATALIQNGGSVAEFSSKAPASAILKKMAQLGVTDQQYLQQVKEIYEQLKRHIEGSPH